MATRYVDKSVSVMESKWYLFPGQTFENTKISDRAHALHITRKAWGNITQHLDRKKRLQEALDKEKRHKEALKQGSQAMTKQWPNSVESLQLRKEQEREREMKEKQEEKIQSFYRLKAEQEAVRNEYVDRMKKQMSMASDGQRELTRALIVSETLYERGKQREFEEKLKRQKADLERRQAEEALALGEKQREEDMEQKEKIYENNRKNAAFLLRTIQENENNAKAAAKARKEEELEDNLKATLEEEFIKKFEREEKHKKMTELAKEKRRMLEEDRQRKETLAKENEEMEKATEFYRQAKYKMDCLMKQKEKEMRQEAIVRQQALAEKVAGIQKAKGDEEARILAKAVAEAEERERANIMAKAAKLQQEKRERIEDREKYMKRKEDEERVEEEVKRWELLNRIKTAEAIREHEKEFRKEQMAKIMQYRKDILEQIADEKRFQKKEREIGILIDQHLNNYDGLDKQFFDYAEEVMQLAKSKNRPTYPIEKVIMAYKKRNNLIKKERSCRCCKN